MTATATVWRTCPVCGRSFGQPDDPGRKRVYCSRACQQAAYRARQRANGAGQWRAGRQDRRHGQRERGGSGADGSGSAGQRQAGGQRRQDNDNAWWRARERYQRGGQRRQEQRQPPPTGANGSGRARAWCAACGGLRAAHTVHHDQAAHQRARRRHEALLRKAAGTSFEHEATACRAKAEALYLKYGL